MIEFGIVALLNATPALVAICETRVYPDPFPDGVTYPAIAYKVIVNKSEPTFDTSGPQRMSIEFRCRSVSALQASTMRELIRQTLEGYRGVLSDGTFLQDAQMTDMMDGYADEARTFVRMIDFHLFFNFNN